VECFRSTDFDPLYPQNIIPRERLLAKTCLIVIARIVRQLASPLGKATPTTKKYPGTNPHIHQKIVDKLAEEVYNNLGCGEVAEWSKAVAC
jgi:hypothetical protein